MTHKHAVMKHIPKVPVPKLEFISSENAIGSSINILISDLIDIKMFPMFNGVILTKSTGFGRETKNYFNKNINENSITEEMYQQIYDQIQQWYRECFDHLLKAVGS